MRHRIIDTSTAPRNAGGLRSEVGYHPTAGKSLHRHFCKTISERRLAAGNIWQRRITVSPVVSMPVPQSVQHTSAEARHGTHESLYYAGR
ncbi:hypothetical protein CDU01_08590 [Cronobacter sakazakii]|nr:hypothetical protein [Cronobacter sakazakii]EGT5652797.1 hypothetical protein [Cronobacter sakazakii]EGT5749513.1 hypothetical protein [Cronobacter sakazakii]EGT5753332.1 hypothetical protein [Cronobacter sakazakii]NCI02348.1 hypothetical protein [Cronobacter sakazakii]